MTFPLRPSPLSRTAFLLSRSPIPNDFVSSPSASLTLPHPHPAGKTLPNRPRTHDQKSPRTDISRDRRNLISLGCKDSSPGLTGNGSLSWSTNVSYNRRGYKRTSRWGLYPAIVVRGRCFVNSRYATVHVRTLTYAQGDQDNMVYHRTKFPFDFTPAYIVRPSEYS